MKTKPKFPHGKTALQAEPMRAPRLIRRSTRGPYYDVQLPSGIVVTYGASTREEALALAQLDARDELLSPARPAMLGRVKHVH